MKARVIATGEIIRVTFDWRDDVRNITYYREVGTERVNGKGGNIYPKKALDFEDTIDWEKRRYEVATYLMPQFMKNMMLCTMPQDVAKEAIYFADALIEELKKEKK